MATKIISNHIVRTPGTCGGRPRIAGHRITVENVMVWHEEMGWSAQRIADEYNLPLAAVHAALAFYFDHKKEIDDHRAEGEAFVRQMRELNPPLLKPRSRERSRGQRHRVLQG